MGRLAKLGLVLALAAVTVGVRGGRVRAATTRTVSANYVAGGATFPSCSLEPQPVGMIGSTCFAIEPGDVSAAIDVRDASGSPAGASFAYSAAGPNTYFYGSTTTAIAPGAT